MTRIQTITLLVAGLVALAIGASILIVPHVFYASYGIHLGQDPNLLSELRAPGASLLALGLVMLAGVFRPGFATVSLGAALMVYGAFPFGRLVSLAIDGVPSSGILAALGLEVAIGLAIAAVFAPVVFRRRSTHAA